MSIENSDISDKIRLFDIYRRLLDSAQSGSVLAIIQSAYRIFNAPLVLTNERYRLIAQWPREPIGDDVYDSLLQGSSLSIDLVLRYTQEYLSDKESPFTPFYVNEGIGGAYPRILAEVCTRSALSNETLGHFGILLGQQDLQSWHLEAADILAKVLAVFLSSRGIMGINAISSANILYDLLDPSLLSSDFESLKHDFLSDFPLPWQLAFVDLAAGTELKTFAPVIAADLARRFPRLAILHEGNELIILSGGNSIRKADGERGKHVDDHAFGNSCLSAATILETYGYSSIVLPPIYIAEKIRHLRRLAQLTWDYVNHMGMHDGKVILYEDLMGGPCYYLLAQNAAASCLCHPVLDRLMLYDEENGTDYYRTLKTYCANNYRSAKTATDLHIHRNTLLYRLERLAELFSLDLSEDRLLQELCLSFRIYELLSGEKSMKSNLSMLTSMAGAPSGSGRTD